MKIKQFIGPLNDINVDLPGGSTIVQIGVESIKKDNGFYDYYDASNKYNPRSVLKINGTSYIITERGVLEGEDLYLKSPYSFSIESLSPYLIINIGYK